MGRKGGHGGDGGDDWWQGEGGWQRCQLPTQRSSEEVGGGGGGGDGFGLGVGEIRKVDENNLFTSSFLTSIL